MAHASACRVGIRADALIYLPVLCALILSAQITQAQPTSPDPFQSTIAPFISKTCTACHNASLRSGDLDLAAAIQPAAVAPNLNTWDKVLAKLKAGQMPPPGIPRPDPAQLQSVTAAIARDIDAAEAQLKPDPGAVVARRLNHSEYNNTVRDLLGVRFHPADDFPQDNSAYGFDNISDALNTTPELMDRYLHAAEQVARAAVYGVDPPKPALAHYVPVYRAHIPPNPIPPVYDFTGLSSVSAMHTRHTFPIDADYDIEIVLNGHRPNQSDPAQVGLWIDGVMVRQGEMDATDLEGRPLTFRIHMTAGEHLISGSYLKEYHHLPPSYGGPEPSNRPPEPLINTRGKLTEQDIETLRKYGTRIKTDRIETRIDNRIDAIDIIGPYNPATGPSKETLAKLFTCGHLDGKHNPGCLRTIVSDFTRRAFRRPAARTEIDSFLKIADLAKQHGDPFNEQVVLALEAILVSPQFLFRIESPGKAAPGQPGYRINDYELASRLSYFLWSSMPDDELLRAAGQGTLHQPEILRAQVARMIRDPKLSALVENFGGQWLQFKNIAAVTPDAERFPDFDEYLRDSMQRETELFLASLIRDNRSILDVLDANYTFLNERLARFYGIDGVTGPEFRQVDMTNTTRGGGVLAQASILTISSYATRTSPVVRGKWILENLLNAPPPPPPPSVPPLDDSKVGEDASLRQQMEAHRQNAVCASCHARMDPLGFSLEHFNAVGEWRDKDGKFDIDASGALPDGRTFQGAAGLKKMLEAQPAAFTAGLTEKLLTYALGRGLEPADRPTLKQIVNDVEAKQYRFQTLIQDIVESLPFRMRRAGGTQ